MKNRGRGGPVMVNQKSQEGFLSRGSIATEGPLLNTRLNTQRSTSSGRFRPCRKRPLFTHALSFPYFLTSLPRYFLPRSAFNSVHGDAAHQLGEKIGGLLGHHFAARRNFHHLVDVAGIQQKRNLRAPAVHGVERRERFPLVRQVGLRRYRLRRDAQRWLQDSFVEQHHVKFALQRRNAWQKLRQVHALAQRQHVERALGQARGINADGPLRARLRELREQFLFHLGPLGAAGERKFFRGERQLEVAPPVAPG